MINSVLGTASRELNTDSKENVASIAPAEPQHFPAIINANTRTGRANPETPHQQYPLQHAPLLPQYQLQSSLLTPTADPTLMDSQSQTGIYLPNPYQTYTPPDLTYAQSYERYNSRTSSPGNSAQQPNTAGVRVIPRRQLRHDLQFDMLSNKTSIFPSLADYITGDDEGLGSESNLYDRPSKRVRYNYPDRRDSSAIGPTDMPPPHMMSCGYGYGPHLANQQSIPPIVPMNAPMTPAASSTHSDESYKFFPAKLSPYRAQDSPDLRRLSQDSDPRRLSVESLLSGPPGIPEERIRKHSDTITSDPRTPLPNPLENGEYLEEMTTWGVDRGFRDLDYGINDDANAISGASPVIKRAYLEFPLNGDCDDVPVEFGFGVQAKDMVFEKNDYYSK